MWDNFSARLEASRGILKYLTSPAPFLFTNFPVGSPHLAEYSDILNPAMGVITNTEKT